MKKIQNILWGILVPIIVTGCLIYKIVLNSFTDHFLGSNPQHIKAFIINKKNYKGNRSSSFAYSYQFEVNGKEYTGNSHDELVKIGDTVDVEYNKDRPGINKPLHPKD